MREIWSILVIIIDSCGRATTNVLDFASPTWADVAYEKLTGVGNYIRSVVKLY